MERLINVLKAHLRDSDLLKGYFLRFIYEDEEFYKEEIELLESLYNDSDKSITITEYARELCQNY